ncbi:hypothetical protein QFC19_008447 [Naganishia cerealis]|uniref:Uncharacterized protein n=1 Tax=Naganishia cerealis TaxID=610337 RepID=A0ACC2V324_9TREE|nr:hypothetical protein QFC19_008447 [Naganishia cerealis]
MGNDPVSSAHQHLQNSYQQLAQVCDSINAFVPFDHIYHPPIIDNHETRYTTQEVSGLAKFRGICEKEADWLAEVSPVASFLVSARIDNIAFQLTHASQPPENLSTNAPYLISVWKEVLVCPRPLISIGETFRSPRGERVKVDVIGKGGKSWIKINTIKLSRLLLEFREQDSYINSDYDSSETEDPILQKQAAAYPIAPINSITKQCYDLIQTASRQRTPWGETPKVQLRLTRLTGLEAQDERIQATYECLRKMGVTVIFGEIAAESTISAESATSAQNTTRPIQPSMLLATPKLNLDLSLLIALVSDISHAPLPRNDEEAETRFKPIDKAWKRQVDPVTGQVTVKKLREGELGPEEHSKALVYQLKQEMRLGLIDELNEKIAESCATLGVPIDQIEFWTTAEARRRCHDIVAKIGGEQERRRETRLFVEESKSNCSAEDEGCADSGAFWEQSRHADRRKPLNRALRVRILPEDDDFTSPSYLQGVVIKPNTFRGRLVETCSRLLSVTIEKGASVTADFLGLAIADSPASSDAELGESGVDGAKGTKVSKAHRGGRRRRDAPLAETYLRVPTAHTIRSMLEGAKRGMTTITANRMSVKQILRAMGPLEALEKDEIVVTGETVASSVAEALFYVVEPKTLGEIKRSDTTSRPASSNGSDGPEASTGNRKQDMPDSETNKVINQLTGAFWVLEPRSLAEDLRRDQKEKSAKPM